jgi:hypothetical protein
MIYTFILFLLLPSALFAFDQQAAFDKANQRYQEGRYADAMPLYHSIENKGPGVWHNLGNCYWHLQQFKDAFCAYKKAFKEASFFDQLILKESIAQSRQLWLNTSEAFASSTVWWDMFVSVCSPFLWQVIFFSMWIILLFCIRRWRYRLFFKISTCMVCILLFLILYIIRCSYTQEMPHAIIIEPTKLFVAPKKEVHILKELCAGDEIIIVDACQDWAKVNAQGVVGWLERSYYKAL